MEEPSSGGLGVFWGFLVTIMFIELHEQQEVKMSLGDIERDATNSEISSKVGATNTGNERLRGKRLKIFCMVLSSLNDDGTRAKSVNNTWGKRCDTLIFITSRKANNLNTVLIPENIQDSRATLWDKVKYGFSHAYSSYYDYDWFLKADDDTYVVMDNLKVYLSGYDTSDPMILGCQLKRKTIVNRNIFKWSADPTEYMSGGAGYVLSKEALRRFVERALVVRRCRNGISWAEDINMAVCMELSKVKSKDTRDYLGRIRFFPLMPYVNGFLRPGRLRHDFWYFVRTYYHPIDGTDGCAESAITFHYASPYMELIEFFLYHLSPNQN